MIVDQVSVVVPLLKLVTRAKVQAAEPCVNVFPGLQESGGHQTIVAGLTHLLLASGGVLLPLPRPAAVTAELAAALAVPPAAGLGGADVHRRRRLHPREQQVHQRWRDDAVGMLARLSSFNSAMLIHVRE